MAGIHTIVEDNLKYTNKWLKLLKNTQLRITKQDDMGLKCWIIWPTVLLYNS